MNPDSEGAGTGLSGDPWRAAECCWKCDQAQTAANSRAETSAARRAESFQPPRCGCSGVAGDAMPTPFIRSPEHEARRVDRMGEHGPEHGDIDRQSDDKGDQRPKAQRFGHARQQGALAAGDVLGERNLDHRLGVFLAEQGAEEHDVVENRTEGCNDAAYAHDDERRMHCAIKLHVLIMRQGRDPGASRHAVHAGPVSGEAPGHQAEEPQPHAPEGKFRAVEFAAGQVRQQPETHAHEDKGGHGAHGEVKVRRNPQGVVHHVVELPTGVDDAPCSAEDETHQRQNLRGHRGVFPGQGRPPAHQPFAAATTSAVFQAERDGEGGDQAGNRNRQRQRRHDPFNHRGDARIGVLMVGAHRQGEHEQQQKGQTGQRVRNQFPSCLPWQQRIDGDIARHQPEIHDGVAGPPEQGAGQQRIDGLRHPERPGIEQEHGLGARAERGEQPHQQRGGAHIGDQRRELTGIGALPASPHLQHDEQRENARHHD